MGNPPVVTAESYVRWRGSSLGRITDNVEMNQAFALAGAALLAMAADRLEERT